MTPISLAPRSAPQQSSLPAAQVQKIQTAAQEFEAMAIGQMLAPMFETTDTSKGMFGGGEGEAAWRPMMISSLAKHMAAHGGLGLAKPIMQQMLMLQEAAHAAG